MVDAHAHAHARTSRRSSASVSSDGGALPDGGGASSRSTSAAARVASVARGEPLPSPCCAPPSSTLGRLLNFPATIAILPAFWSLDESGW